MMSLNSVNVSVEVPAENLVHEITYDGQEILQTPLSMSDNLTRLAQRIDFCRKDEVSDGAGGSECTEESGSNDQTAECTFKTLPVWPWDQVRNKMRFALTELSVLSDLLQLSHQKKYIILDPVQADPPEPRPAATLLYKKKGLAAASSVLISGADKLRNSLNEAKSRSSLSSLPDFHIELLRLRQNWRLRKVGNSILGDLSYKTAGSRFAQAGIFEVTKAEDDADGCEIKEEYSSGSNSQQSLPKPTSALRVVVPNELQGISYIQVLIQKDQDVLSMANIGLLGPAPAPAEAQWQQRLEAAQNVLFCRELFVVLAREAVLLNSMPIPPLVVGNQITSTLFPGILLIIGLCHGDVGKGRDDATQPTNTPKMDHNHVLEHSLHQLLREVHRQNCSFPLPHPSTAPIGVSKRRRLAGPLAYERYTLLQMTKKEMILQEMIRQAQHVVLRLRTMYVLDTLAREIKDPLIVAHWASLNAVTHSCVRLNFLSSGYDMTTRTPLIIHVKEKSLKCILKDGKAIHLSYEPQELRDIILSQIAIHQIMALQSLSKCMGYNTLSSSAHLGVGHCENLGNAAGCLLSSPNGKRIIAIRSSPQTQQSPHSGIEVFIGIPPGTETDSTLQSDAMEMEISKLLGSHSTQPYQTNGTTYKTVRLDKLEGKNFLNKMEMLMAVLADS